MKKKKILIIDDEEDLCNLVKDHLEITGLYEVTIAMTGEDGVKKAKEAPYDLVITDYGLPHMDGEEVIDAIKEMYPGLPILLFTIYYDDPATLRTGIKHKADGVLGKPVEHKKLKTMIEKLLKKN